MFADEFLPVYDVPGEVATVAAAEPQVVWEALFGADLVEPGKRTPLAGLLGALRVLPELVSHLLHGERPPQGPASLRLGGITGFPPGQGGWVLLGEWPGEQLAVGLAGKFWRPVIGGRARRWFRRYWTFGVGSGAHILVHALLEMIRQTAEDARTTAAGQAR